MYVYFAFLFIPSFILFVFFLCSGGISLRAPLVQSRSKQLYNRAACDIMQFTSASLSLLTVSFKFFRKLIFLIFLIVVLHIKSLTLIENNLSCFKAAELKYLQGPTP